MHRTPHPGQVFNTRILPTSRVSPALGSSHTTRTSPRLISKPPAAAVETTAVEQSSGLKKSKKSHTKSRGGCTTCKYHRVRCDETRPACLRCVKLLRKCGYVEKRNTGTQRTLRPKEPATVEHLIEPTQQLFNSNQEYQYFVLFRENIAAKLSPYFSNSKWEEMILQACASDRTIREICIAISALNLTLTVGSCTSGFATRWTNLERLPPPGLLNFHSLSTNNAPKDAMPAPHHWFALQQYGKAIRRMRENISTGQQNIRTTLLACIVTTCFEVMHGSHDAASAQLQSGIILYQNWKNRQPNASSHTMGFSSPAPDVVDDFLSQTLGRMELQTMSFTDKRPTKCHQRLLLEGAVTTYNMPAEFATVEQARIYLDLIMRRLLHYVGSVSLPDLLHLTGPPSVSRLFSPKSNMHTSFEGNGSDFDDAGFGSALHQQQLSEIGVKAEGAQLTADLNRWSDAFDPTLAQKYLVSTEPSEKVAALTLKIAALSAQSCTSGALNGDETRYDIFLYKFQQIIDYATELLSVQDLLQDKKLKDAGPVLLFCFEMGVIPPLSIVAIKCRNSRLRRKALKLLIQYPRREGVWDSAITADLSRWAISLEEGWDGAEDPWTEDSEEFFIPDNQRVKSVGLQYELESGRVAMGCLQMDSVSGRWLTRNREYVCEGWGL